ncbi:putative reverse transcriptase domain-containing protein, partial [Tanacetum coccineum]
RNDARGSRLTRGEDVVPSARECTFAEFMKCNPTDFRDTKGAVERARFAAVTQQGPALTWRISKIATMGLEIVNQIPWTEMKQLMTAEFCPIEEIQCHTRNRCPRKVKQEEVGEVRGRAYAIKDTEPKGLNVVTMNHIFEIDFMPIELGMFDVIIGMDWLVKQDAVIVCSEKVVRILYGNKMLIVESDKGVSRLKVISCIKARKYVERGCHLFLAHVTEKKSKEKLLEDMHVIHYLPEVFPEEFPGLPPPRQVEFQIDLVPGAAPVARAPYRLTPSEMRELSVQLQELLEKGFIRPSSSP